MKDLKKEDLRKLGYEVVDAILDHYTDIKDKPVHQYATYDELKDKVDRGLPRLGQHPKQVLAEIYDLLCHYSTHTDHPRFFAFIPSPSDYISTLAETLATGMNIFSGHWLASSAAGAIEKTTIRWLCSLMGYDPDQAGGIFTSGGSLANLSALITARDVLHGGFDAKARFYCSDQAHSSVFKAIRLLGYHTEQSIVIPTDDHYQISVSRLTQRIRQDLDEGLKPLAIIANAGTTNTGSIDDLTSIADIAKENNIWMHVDGAYGAAAILTDQGKTLLSGMERADSITLDPHKWWFQPYEAGCLLVRNARDMLRTFAVSAAYLDDTMVAEGGEVNYYDHGIQLTRSFKAVKLYAYLRSYGLDTLRDHIQGGMDYAYFIQGELEARPGWTLMTPASLGIVAFRFVLSDDETSNDKINTRISAFIQRSGYAMITTSKLGDRVILRMCPIHPKLTKIEILKTLDLLDQAALDDSEVIHSKKQR